MAMGVAAVAVNALNRSLPTRMSLADTVLVPGWRSGLYER